MRLKDRVAIVTGGGGGIGEGICKVLAKEGATIVVSDLNLGSAETVAETVRRMGQKAIAVQADVRQADQCREMVDKTLDETGAWTFWCVMQPSSGEGLTARRITT